MGKTVYLRMNSDGYVIGGYVSQLHAAQKTLELDKNEHMIKVTVSLTDDQLSHDEAIQIIKTFKEENK